VYPDKHILIDKSGVSFWSFPVFQPHVQNRYTLSHVWICQFALVFFSGGTWMRVGVWLVMGVFVYIFYGRTHSSLTDVVYVPVAEANEIYGSSSASEFVA
jgi:hypothetical protein